MPKDICAIHIQEVSRSFHPTVQACRKDYHYHICNSFIQLPFYRQFSWHFRYGLDTEKMQKGAQMLIGKHDFSSFCNDRALLEKDAVKQLDRIDIQVLPESRLRILVHGDHFLYKMVRNIVGTLAYVGCGKISVDDVTTILESKDRKQAGITAPAHGLILKHVFYN